jgi:hypothetical protein
MRPSLNKNKYTHIFAKAELQKEITTAIKFNNTVFFKDEMILTDRAFQKFCTINL